MKWKKGSDPKSILDKLSASRTLNSDGSLSSPNFFEADRWRTVLFSIIEDETVSSIEKGFLVKKASAYAQNLSRSGFEGAYKRHRHNLASFKSKFVIAFPLWGRTEYLSGSRRFDGVTLNFSPSHRTRLYNGVIESRSNLKQRHQREFETVFKDADSSKLVFCSVEAASAGAAQDSCVTALQRYLGAVTFWDNWGRDARIYFGLQKPVNEILVKPFITAHSPANGRLLYDGFWYHHWYPKFLNPSRRNPDRTTIIASQANETLERARNSLWREKALRALEDYFIAFSEHEPRNAFLGGWRLLELIGGWKNSDYHRIVRRAARCFSDANDYQLLGEHLRRQREDITHFGSALGEDGDIVALQMKEFISPLLRLYLTNPFKFSCEEELWEFLDLSNDRVERHRKEKLLGYAKVFYRD